MPYIAPQPNPRQKSESMHRSHLINKSGRLRIESLEGLFVGTAIGDALGLPLETLAPHQIEQRFGHVTTILDPSSNQLIEANQARRGMISDDTQLTLALAKGLLDPSSVSFTATMDSIAREHVAALRETTVGWGGTTKDAVKRLSAGINWKESGNTAGPGTGKGNGVVMKIAPLAAFAISQNLSPADTLAMVDAICAMTHNSPLAIASARAHLAAIQYALLVDADNFSPKEFVNLVTKVSRESKPQDEETRELSARFESLAQAGAMDLDQLIANFGGGTCYVLNSLPFSYALFLRDWQSIEALYATVNAGGDTDSNAAMVGALLGALHGKDLFPPEHSAGVADFAAISAVAQSFSKKILALN